MKDLYSIFSQKPLNILTPLQSSQIKGGNPGGNGNGNNGNGRGNNGCPPPWQ